MVLLETHGTEEHLRLVLRTALASHNLVFHSGLCKEGRFKSDGGGVAILVAKSLDALCPSPPLIFSPGRLGRVTVQVGEISIAIYPTHNYDISSPQMKLFEETIQEDMRLAKANPTSFLVLLLGDFNLEPLDCHRISIPNPASPGASGDLAPEDILPVDARARRWQKVFDGLTEVCSPAPTHFYSPQLFLNQIDRIFISAPRSAMCLFNEKGGGH